MAVKKIVLDFKAQPVAGSAFSYDIYINGTLLVYGSSINTINLNYIVGANNSPYQIGIGTDLDDTIDKTIAFLNSIYYFSGFVGGFSVVVSYQRVGDAIEAIITTSATANQVTFWKVFSSNTNLNFRTDTPCETAMMYNQVSSSFTTGVIYGFAPGTYYVKNTTLNITKTVTIPSSFDCVFDKGFGYVIKDSGNATLLGFSIPASVISANLNLVVINNDLTITLVGTNAFVVYSIDGTTYQTSNLFVGIPLGTTTLYIRDRYGCIRTFPVLNTGDENGNTVQAYHYISEINSIRLVQQVVHGNCGNYKNIYNTLSCQENLNYTKPNKFIQLFQTCDIEVKTQIKTSYENIEVYGIDQDGVLTELTANKIVNNIGIEDKRDCQYYSYNGQLAITYSTGNTYDYGTTTVNGTFELNGSLPQYGVVGTWLETAYGNLQIVNIIISDDGQRSLLMSANIAITGVVNGTVQTIYNRESYNIWEFNTDMSLFADKTFHLGLRFYQTVPDAAFPDVYYLSEKILVKARHPRSLYIQWSNTKNNDIYYYSGIVMKNRLNFADINTRLSDGSVEIERTDSEVVSIDATNYKAYEFEVLNLTTGMAGKILLALMHDVLVIENIPYKLAENPELTRKGKSNFYDIKAKLLEAGDVFNQGTANTQVIYTNTELIGLLQGDANAEYIRIL